MTPEQPIQALSLNTRRVVTYWTIATVVAHFLNHLCYQYFFYNLLVNALRGRTNTLDVASPSLFMATMAQGLCAGVLIGGAQWVVLRRYNRGAHWWFLATVVGWAASVGVNFAFLGLTAMHLAVTDWILSLGTASLLVYGAMTGLVVGLVQWVVLRRWGSRTLIWILIVIVAQAVSDIGGGPLRTYVTAAALLSWLAQGLITGAGMAFLLNQKQMGPFSMIKWARFR
jgi:hypothetical protein